MQLHLSRHTIKHHIERVRDEVGARNRTELAAWAGRNGFYRPGRGRRPSGSGSADIKFQAALAAPVAQRAVTARSRTTPGPTPWGETIALRTGAGMAMPSRPAIVKAQHAP